MKYLLLKDFLNQAKISKSTLYKFHRDYPVLKKETKLVSNRRLIPEEHLKYFNLQLFIEIDLRQKKKVRELKSLIDCIHDAPDYQFFYWRKHWDIYGTISYKNEEKAIGCYQRMVKLFEHLEHHYSSKTNITLFFNTEEYGVRNGHHNHFLLYCSERKLIGEIKEEIKRFFSFDRVDLQKYNKHKPAVFYITKGGLKKENWDYMYF